MRITLTEAKSANFNNGLSCIGLVEVELLEHPVILMLEGENGTLHNLADLEQMLMQPLEYTEAKFVCGKTVPGPLTRKPFAYRHLEPVRIIGSTCCRFEETASILLYHAVGERLMERVEDLIDMRADPSHRVGNDTALHVAVGKGDIMTRDEGGIIRLINALTKATAPTTNWAMQTIMERDTPMHTLAKNCPDLGEVMRKLAEKDKGMMHVRNAAMETPLMAAIAYADAKLKVNIPCFIECGAQLFMRFEEHWGSPIETAIMRGVPGVECLEAILDHNLAYVNLPLCVHRRYTATMLAVQVHNVKAFKLCVSKFADLTRRDIHKNTVMHYAAETNSGHLISAVIEACYKFFIGDSDEDDDDRVFASTYINARNAIERTPLHVAVARSTAVAVHHFLQQPGCQVDTCDALGHTPLHTAVVRGEIEIARMLLEYDDAHRVATACRLIDIKEREKGGGTAVHAVLTAMMTAMVVDSEEDTPYNAAVKHSRWLVLLSMLLHFEPQLNLFDAQGFTPLHVAASICDIDAMKRLIAAGAPLSTFYASDTPEKMGNTPLGVLLVGQQPDARRLACIRVLLLEQPSLLDMPCRGRTTFPLHVASAAPNVAMLQHLLALNPSTTACENAQKETPLHIAAQLGLVENVQALLRSDHNFRHCIYHLDIHKATPLHYAAMCDDLEVWIQILASASARTPTHRGTPLMRTPLELLLQNKAATPRHVRALLDKDPSAPLLASFPLHVAVAAGDDDCTLLLSSLLLNTKLISTQLTAVDSKGELALDVAKRLQRKNKEACLRAAIETMVSVPAAPPPLSRKRSRSPL